MALPKEPRPQAYDIIFAPERLLGLAFISSLYLASNNKSVKTRPTTIIKKYQKFASTGVEIASIRAAHPARALDMTT